MRYFLAAICLCLLPSVLPGQQLVINEILPSNHEGIKDFDGDRPDWIELYNTGDSPISLEGFALTDDPDEPAQWSFPAISVPGGGRVLVFASGKNRSQKTQHLETIIRQGDQWHYFIGDATAPPDWQQPDFDASDWPVGPSGFGYGDGDDSTDVDSTAPFEPFPPSVYIRKAFTVDSLENITQLMLHVDYDDAFVAYLNGVEVTRENIGTPGVEPPYDELALDEREARMYRGLDPVLFDLSGARQLLRQGENVFAIQTHNVDRYSSDITMIPYLTLVMGDPPPNARGVAKDLDIQPPRLHTNFSLDADGEQLLLFNANGDTVDQVSFASVPADYSYGRRSDGGPDWGYFPQPTPDSSNTTTSFPAFNQTPELSTSGGFYDTPVQVDLVQVPSVGTVRYTLDGSLPDTASPQWEGSLSFDTTGVLRVRTFGGGNLPSRARTQTYFIGENIELPVVSLVSDPDNLFSSDRGIYARGDEASSSFPYHGANFHKDWERPVHLELFEKDRQQGFELSGGIKMHGSWTLGFPQKSLAIYARGEYGAPEIRYPLFPSKDLPKYEAFILRNGGNDWGWTMFRDPLTHRIADNQRSDAMAYRPVVVYINGQYWGIHNMREKQNEHYLATHHPVSPENLDLIENHSVVSHGDIGAFQTLREYVSQHSLRDIEHFQYIREQIDVENFVDYMITRMFAATTDWPWNNVKMWRPRTSDGEWRWIMYDADFAFHGGHYTAETNMFNELQNTPNFTGNFFMKLIYNEEFKRLYLNRYLDRLNTNYKTDSLLKLVDQHQSGIEADMPRHIERWKGTFQDDRYWLSSALVDMNDWKQNIGIVRDFMHERPGQVMEHLMGKFSLSSSDRRTVTIEVPSGKGRVQLNSLEIANYPWQGDYFAGIPITLVALPAPGYRLDRWEGTTQTADSIEVNPGQVQTIKAHFVRDTIQPPPVVINEINYHSSDSFNPEDWVEFYNSTDSTIALEGWQLKDEQEEQAYVFSTGDTIGAGQYRVVSQDTTAFKNFFTDVPLLGGPLDFGFGADGEVVRLYDGGGQLIDSVRYDDSTPWPEQPDGNGPALALRQTNLDNDIAENWGASEGHGSPGAENRVVTDIEDKAESGDIPGEVRLKQNYPNPFNPTTTIAFSLPEARQVSLRVYDVLGRQVATLADQKLSAGQHTFTLDASGWSSGLYIYRLKAGTKIYTRKMMLMK